MVTTVPTKQTPRRWGILPSVMRRFSELAAVRFGTTSTDEDYAFLADAMARAHLYADRVAVQVYEDPGTSVRFTVKEGNVIALADTTIPRPRMPPPIRRNHR